MGLNYTIGLNAYGISHSLSLRVIFSPSLFKEIDCLSFEIQSSQHLKIIYFLFKQACKLTVMTDTKGSGAQAVSRQW